MHIVKMPSLFLSQSVEILLVYRFHMRFIIMETALKEHGTQRQRRFLPVVAIVTVEVDEIPEEGNGVAIIENMVEERTEETE